MSKQKRIDKKENENLRKVIGRKKKLKKGKALELIEK